MKKKEFLKIINSVNPGAAEILQKMLTKAASDPEYAEYIRFTKKAFRGNTARDCILWGFDWEHTPEGNMY